MQTKTLLILLLVAAFSSCSTAYKTGQTPDDVYFSPVSTSEDRQDNDNERDQANTVQATQDWQVRMAARDRRWRYIDDYNYSNSPYNYCYCNCGHYTGYYYNPYFYPAPIYNVKLNTFRPDNTPRMVNLAAYHNYNPVVAVNSKTTTGSAKFISVSNYNNSNSSSKSSSKGLGNTVRRVLDSKSSSSSSSSSESRTYTPSSSSSSSSSGSSSSSSSSGSNSRPARGN